MKMKEDRREKETEGCDGEENKETEKSGLGSQICDGIYKVLSMQNGLRRLPSSL